MQLKYSQLKLIALLVSFISFATWEFIFNLFSSHTNGISIYSPISPEKHTSFNKHFQVDRQKRRMTKIIFHLFIPYSLTIDTQISEIIIKMLIKFHPHCDTNLLLLCMVWRRKYLWVTFLNTFMNWNWSESALAKTFSITIFPVRNKKEFLLI